MSEPEGPTTPGPVPNVKVMKLRFAGTCGCGTDIAAGTRAGWDRDRRTVVCVACIESARGDTVAASDPATQTGTAVELAANADIGRAGDSLQREYERRSAAREARIRDRHPKLGGLILALTDEPGSTRAFKTGAAGERQAAVRMQELCAPHVLFLLNRRLGPARREGDIDILAIGPTGVYVVDVKQYPDKEIKVRRSGGLFTPVREQLLVGGRDRTKLLTSLDRQRAAISDALADFTGPIPAVAAILCFVDALLPLFGTPTIAGVPLLGPKATAKRLQSTGAIDEPTRQALHQHLAQHLPPA